MPIASTRLAGLILAALAFVATAPPAVAQLPSAETTKSTAPPPQASAAAQSLAEVEERRLQLQEWRASTEALLARRSELSVHLSVLEHAESLLSGVELDIDAERARALGVDQLLGEETTVRSQAREIEDTRAALSGLVRDFDQALDRAMQEAQVWERLRALAETRAAPETLVARIEAILTRVGDRTAELRAVRDEALLVLDRATTLMVHVHRVGAEVERRRSAWRAAQLEAVRKPLWQMRPRVVGDALQTFASTVRAGVFQLERYLEDNRAALASWFAASAGLTWLLLAVGRRTGWPPDWAREIAPGISSVLGRPALAAFVAGATALFFLAPLPPQAWLQLIGLAIPLPAAYLAARAFARPARLSVYALAAALALLAVRSYVQLLPVTDRLVVIAQCLGLGGALLLDWRRGGIGRMLPRMSPEALRMAVWSLAVALGIAALAEVVGAVSLSRPLRDSIVGGLGLWLVVAVVVTILCAAGYGLLRLRWTAALRSVHDQPAIPFRLFRRTAIGFGALLWIVAYLRALDALDTTGSMVNSLLDAKAQIGQFEIGVAGVLLAAALGIVTWLTLRLTRFVLETEILPRLRVGQGRGYVISVLVRYALGVVGFLLIVSALGIDLTKITVLVGALGVGIGFGLQNVINNFVSGLILLFEQPVKINDTVMLDTLGGKVQRIGVRATTIRTFDGADVVVPNSEFISKHVTNWTLSDQQRRAEVTVGVGYGADVEQVLALLLEVARAHPEVMPDPAPFVWFTGFGDSSLDFKLHAWVADAGTAFQVASDLRAAILRRFREAGIEIPYPQRDLHLRSSDVALAPALGRDG
jgi:small-conductance mechanosensitive channel